MKGRIIILDSGVEKKDMAMAGCCSASVGKLIRK